jgi:four helix bundle protein
MDLSSFKLLGFANQISDLIWEEVILWDYFKKDTIGKQVVRSADSISANLSESYGRYTFPDRKRFIFYARGSLCETITWIEKAISRELISEDKGKEIIQNLQKLSVFLNRQIKSLNERSK